MSDASDDAASAPASESSGPSEPPDVTDYTDLLSTLDVLEKEALRKVESGRVYDAEAERVRIKWIRVTKDVVAEKRKTSEARDLEVLSERLERLERDRGVGR